MSAAKNRAIDRLRHRKLHARKAPDIALEIEARHAESAPDPDAALDDEVGDDLLRLIFIACHPVLPAESRLALTLRLIGGLVDAGDRPRLPGAGSDHRPAHRPRQAHPGQGRCRLRAAPRSGTGRTVGSVLEVVYLIFNEGYAATAGEDWLRPALCDEALRLGRILSELAPDEPEVHGLVALMEIQASRNAARVGPSGEPVLLLDQDRRRWDYLLIRRGLAALDRAVKLGGAQGPYALQAAVAACHARAASADQTDWPRIAALYAELSRVTPSPIVDLNRAVAVSMAQGPAVGLDLVDALAGEPSLRTTTSCPASAATS